MAKKRKCGVLLPISSLPSKYGIGCFDKKAYEFVECTEGCRPELLADPAAGADQLWRFSIPVLLHFCWKSIFYQPGRADKRRGSHQK